jgi:hypothetical protein
MRYHSSATLRFMPTPQEWADNWSAGVSGASQKYTQGIQNTTIDVVGRALAKQGEMVAGFNQAVSPASGRGASSARRHAGWKAAADREGANYATGATAGLPRFQTFAQQAQPFWAQLSANIDNDAVRRQGERSGPRRRLDTTRCRPSGSSTRRKGQPCPTRSSSTRPRRPTRRAAPSRTRSTANSGDSLAIPNFVERRCPHRSSVGDRLRLGRRARADEHAHRVDPRSAVRHPLQHPVPLPGGAGKPAAHTLIKEPMAIPVFSGDTGVMTVTTTAGDGILVSWLTEYDDLPGTAGSFASWEQVQALRETTIGLRCAPVASGTVGAYGTQRALNADDTRLTGGKYYAILGWTVQTPVCTVALQATNWGNNRIGLPQGSLDLRTDMGFVELSQALRKPLIPIINGYDAGNVLLSVADDAASTSPKVDVLMYQLSSNPLP